MHDTIRQIFHQNKNLLEWIDKAVFYFRTQNFDPALRLVTAIIDQINPWLEHVTSESEYFNENQQAVNMQDLINLIQCLLEAQEKEDYILLADLYETQWLPMLFQLQTIIIEKEGLLLNQEMYNNNIKILKKQQVSVPVFYDSIEKLLDHMEEGYSVEYTSGGEYTIAVTREARKYYFHSNHSVAKEAFQLAASWYSEHKTSYIVYGLGFGYHVKELLELDKNIIVEVYESDKNIIQLACAFTEIGQVIQNPNLTLHYDPDFSRLSERIMSLSQEDEFVIHYPSMYNIRNVPVRERLEMYFLQYSSIKNQLRLLHGNFRRNITCYNGMADELRKDFQGKDLYIVAAGPSLDSNYLKLKEVKENSVILATGTVLKKLINAGIRPDYFIVTDANERVYAQISGLEKEDIPMLYLSTAYHGFAENYQGKKYIIFQRDYGRSEQYAREKGTSLYKTGGSVSTTALDIGIALGCRRIIFLGLDLAYPNNYVHAAGTSRRELSGTDNLRQVEDIYGNMIYTSKSLHMYKEWIEERIRGVKEVEFIDATEGGVQIKGMKTIRLDEIINERGNR